MGQGNMGQGITGLDNMEEATWVKTMLHSVMWNDATSDNVTWDKAT